MDFFPVVFIFVIFFGPNERLIIIFRHSFSLAAFVVVAAEVEILLCCVMIKATCTNSICWLSDYFSFRPNTKKHAHRILKFLMRPCLPSQNF